MHTVHTGREMSAHKKTHSFCVHKDFKQLIGNIGSGSVNMHASSLVLQD